MLISVPVVVLTAVTIAGAVAVRRYRRVAQVGTVVAAISLLMATVVTGAQASPLPQKSFKIANATVKGTVGKSIKVVTSGGSGSGAIKFAVTGSHCTITPSTGYLSASAPATCSVVATKAATATYQLAKSAAVRFTFVAAPAPFKIVNSSLTGQVGVVLTVVAKGGAGNGAVSYDTTGSVCSINPTTGALSAFALGSCPVTATKAASGPYASVTSPTVTFVFGPGPQAPLTITNSPLTGTVGVPLGVVTSGGSGSGALTLSVTGAGCTVDNNAGTVTAASAGSCVVKATKAASSGYLAASSSAVTFTFTVSTTGGTPTPQTPDKAVLTSITGIVGTTINDTVNGDKWFINQYYSPTDRWLENYVTAGSAVTLTWTVTGPNGKPLANQPVTLYDNLDYSKSTGTTWSVASLNQNPNGNGQFFGGTLTGTTNANGVVSFTMTNTNASTGSVPADTTTTAGAEANELTYPWTRVILQVGTTDVFTGTSGVNQATDLVDLIVIP